MPHALLPERGVLRLSGADARDLLQGLITNNVDRLTPASAIYAALLSPQGKYLFDFFLSELDGDLLLDCEAARLGLLAQRLTLYKLRSAVKIEDASSDLAVAVAFGEEALPALELPDTAGAARAFGGGIAYVDPRLAAAGARLVLSSDSAADVLQASGLPTASAEDYDAHRLALGLPDGSRDLAVDKAILVESNFEALNGIDFKKGCYVGQELTARTKYRGLVRRRLLPVDVDGPLPEPETQILLGGKDAGTVRSGRGRRALAVLRLEALEKIGAGEGELTAGDARLEPVLPGWADFELPQRN